MWGREGGSVRFWPNRLARVGKLGLWKKKTTWVWVLNIVIDFLTYYWFVNPGENKQHKINLPSVSFFYKEVAVVDFTLKSYKSYHLTISSDNSSIEAMLLRRCQNVRQYQEFKILPILREICAVITLFSINRVTMPCQYQIRRKHYNEDIIRMHEGLDSFPPPFDFGGLSRSGSPGSLYCNRVSN